MKPKYTSPPRVVALATAALLVVFGTVFALRQADSRNPYRSDERLWWNRPLGANRFAQRMAIRSDLAAVAVNGPNAVLGGTGGLLLWSENAGATWNVPSLPTMVPVRAGDPQVAPRPVPPDSTRRGPGVSEPGMGIVGNAGSTTSFRVRDGTAGAGGGIAQRLLAWLRPSDAYALELGLQDSVVRVPAGSFAGSRGIESGTPASTVGATSGVPAADSTRNGNPLIPEGSPPPNFGRRRTSTLIDAPDVLSVAFANTHIVIAVTGSGEILRSTDSGRAWSYVMLGLSRLNHVVFASSSVGYVAGQEGLYMTRDTGRTWSRIPTSPRDLRRIAAPDPSTIYVQSGDSNLEVYSTSFAKWELRTPPLQGEDAALTGWVVADVVFASSREGWVGFNRGRQGRLYHTSDGGANWQPSRSPLPAISAVRLSSPTGSLLVTGVDGSAWRCSPAGAECNSTYKGPSLNDLAFDQDGVQGVAVGQDGTVAVTADGGLSWRVRSGGGDMLRSIDLVDQFTGWAVGSGGAILRTVNGGETWYPQNSGVGVSLFGIRGLTRNGAVAVGAQSTVLRTADAGRTWVSAAVDSATGETLKSVDMAGNAGVAVGENGAVFVTSDGGRSWARRRAPGLGDLVAVRFGTATDVWIVGESGKLWRAGHLVGGGTDTTYTPTIPGDLTSVDVRGSRVWGVGTQGLVFMSSDSGRSWATKTVEGRPDFTGVRFVSADTGWAVTREGSVYATADGGVQWRLLQRDTSGMDLNGLTVAGREVWAVGKGKILRRTTGWTNLSRGLKWPAPWYYAMWVLVLPLILWGAQQKVEPVTTIEEMIVSDRPIRSGDRDVLGLRPIALTISRFLRNENTEPPLTLAVTGRWGSGKSSLMNLIREDLASYGALPVWFNAWHHQTEESLLAALLENIRRQAVPVFSASFRMRLLWVRLRKEKFLARLAALVLLGYVVYLLSDLDRVWRVWGALRMVIQNPPKDLSGARAILFPADATSGSPVGVLLGSLISFALFAWSTRPFGVKPSALLATVMKSARPKDLEAKTSFRYRFAEEFQEVTRALRRDLVIFVDDLDRCRPQQVMDVLEAINFLYSSGRCIIVMGMDPDRVIRCVAGNFKDEADLLADALSSVADPRWTPVGVSSPGGESESVHAKQNAFAVQYLEKLVNIEVPVPAGGRALADLLSPEPQPELRYPRLGRLRSATRWVDRNRRKIAGVMQAAIVVALTLVFVRVVFPPVRNDGGSGETRVIALAPPVATSPLRASPDAVPEAARRAVEAKSAPARLVPGTTDTTSNLLLYFAVVLWGLLTLWRFFTDPESVVHDSEEFTEALKTWGPFVATKRATPRAMKKYLNRVRYYAMTQRPRDERPSLWKRILARLEIRPPLAQPPLSDTELVALASIYEYDPSRIDHPRTYARFRDTTTALLESEPRPVDRYPVSMNPDATMKVVKAMVSSIRVI
jgi:photosystem II stability/assembly factor-like uncharacterized protein